MPMIQTDSKHYTDIANAIRAKNGLLTQYYPEDMAGAIQAIPQKTDTSKLAYDDAGVDYIIQGRYAKVVGYPYSGCRCYTPQSDTDTNRGSNLYNPFYGSSKFKISIRVKRFGSANSQMVFGDGQTSKYGHLPAFEVMSNNCIGVGYGTGYNSWSGWISLTTAMTSGTWYIAQFEWTGTKVYMRMLNSDGSTVVEEQSSNFSTCPAPNDSSANPAIGGFGYSSGHSPTYLLFDFFNSFLSKDGSMIWGCNELGLPM